MLINTSSTGQNVEGRKKRKGNGKRNVANTHRIIKKTVSRADVVPASDIVAVERKSANPE
jgi:hypothetical protein